MTDTFTHARLISDKQIAFARRLLADRLVTLGFTSIDEAAEKMNLESLPIRDASTIIDRLKSMPIDPDPTVPAVVLASHRWGRGNRPGVCATCGHTVANDEGFYYAIADGKWAVHHRADECDTSTPAPVANEVEEGFYLALDGAIVQVYMTGTKRLAGKVMNESGKFVYQTGSLRLAQYGGARLTPQQVANAQCIAIYGAPIGSPELLAKAVQHSAQSGACMFCARVLDDPRSNPALGGAGYGPVCATNYGLPWGK